MEWGEGRVRPAEPLLANSLVGDGVVERLFEDAVCGKRRLKKERSVLGTGVKSVDEALGGGIDGGRVVGVSCEVGGVGGGVDLSFGLLTTSLLQIPTSTAAIIDTTGNIDILRLYTLLLSRLQASPSLLSTFQPTPDAENLTAEEVAAKALDRVKIMRVFDLVGVMEAVSEIREGLEGKKLVEGEAVEKKVSEAEAPVRETRLPEPLPRETIIADSEDEEEDEMLFENEAAVTAQPAVPPAPEPHFTPSSKSLDQQNIIKGTKDDKVSFILIDNLAHIVNPLLKKDYIQTHTLSTSFLLTLSNLTRTHTVYTILMNPFNPLRPLPLKQQLPSNQHGPSPQQQQYQTPPPPSIFASNKAIPALGNILAPYLDLHLMVEKMPRRKEDAKIVYAEAGNGGLGVMSTNRHRAETVCVVEVVSDRWEGRVGAWGVLGGGERGVVDMR